MAAVPVWGCAGVSNGSLDLLVGNQTTRLGDCVKLLDLRHTPPCPAGLSVNPTGALVFVTEALLMALLRPSIVRVLKQRKPAVDERKHVGVATQAVTRITGFIHNLIQVGPWSWPCMGKMCSWL